MASIAVALSSFRPLYAAGARPKSRNPRNKPSPHQNPNPSPNFKLKPQPKLNLKTQIGSEATTYTRLPPKDDAELSSSISTVIKLHESALPARTLGKSPIFEEEESLGLDSDEEEDDLDFKWEEDEVESARLGSDSEMVGEEIDVGEVKEKGVPAVMRCFDTAKIYVKAGDGGNGAMAFRREKYVPFGGPSGGDGGRGGSVYVEVDAGMNSLLPFRKSLHFRAGRGAHGQGKEMAGARGEDVVVKVAAGTVVRDAKTDEVLLELTKPGDRALLLRGGRGGRGNASFKSGMNKAPKIAENGEEGAEM